MSTTNILDLNNRIDALEKNSGGGGSADSAKRSDIATEFSATTAYTAGCFVYYEGKLYQFNADHAAGAWDPTDVAEANVTDQVVSNASAIAGLTASDISYDNTTSGLSATNEQAAIDELAESYPADKVMMSDDVTSVEDAIDGLTVVKIDEAAANQTYQKQLTDLTNSYNSLSDRQKQRAYIMVGTTKFITISAEGQFMHHDAGGSGLVATTLNCITHTAYNVNSSSVTSIDSNTNTNTMALYA